MENNDKNTEMSQSCKNAVMVSASFELFKYEFLSNFIFKPIERPDFLAFLKLHYEVYNIIYKSIYSINTYSKSAIKDNPIEFKNYGIELNPNNIK